jgi:hypothetical protein
MRVILLNLLILATGVCAENAAGQTLLRWKLKADDALRLTILQETESQVAFSGKSATTKIELAVELDWLVTAADEKEIKLKQTLRGVKLKLQSPEGGVIDYDSAAKDKPSGQAREMAESIQPLIGMELAVTMTPRGDVVAAEPANKAAEELLADAKPGEQAGASRAQVQQLLKQSLVILPEKEVALNDTWTNTSNLSGAAGEFQQVTTYRLAGLIEQNGQTVAQLEMNAKLDPAAGKSSPGKKSAAGKLRVKDHQQQGTIAFAVSDGRLIEAEQTQKLVTERPYRDITIVVTLMSKQTTKVQTKP